MKRRLFLLVLILLGMVILVALIFLAIHPPAHAANTLFTNLSTLRAMRVDYLDEDNSRGEVADLETHMQQAGVTLVALGAGAQE